MSTLTPHRIGLIQYLRAEVATALDLPTHPGADDHWHPLNDLRDTPATSRATDTPTAIIPAIRRPAAALTNVPYQLVDVPHLGVLPIGPLEDAHLYNQLKGERR